MTWALSAKDTGYPVITLLVMCVPISMKTNNDANNSHIESYLFNTYHLWQPLFSSTVTTTGSLDTGKYIWLLVLHEKLYDATENKHVYNNYSHQTVPLFTFWGLKHNHTKVNKPSSLYLSSKCRVYAPWSRSKLSIRGNCVVLRLKFISVIRWSYTGTNSTSKNYNLQILQQPDPRFLHCDVMSIVTS